MTALALDEPRADAPIVLYATMGFDSYTFSLDIESRDALEAVIGSDATRALPRRVTIALDLKQPFETAFGSVYRHVIPLLTSLSLDDLDRLGGVEVQDSKTDQVLWRSA